VNRTGILGTLGENGEEWRRLHVVWPSYLATHSSEQTLYVGSDGLFRRHDYDVEIIPAYALIPLTVAGMTRTSPPR
jgi:hypothetical protein